MREILNAKFNPETAVYYFLSESTSGNDHGKSCMERRCDSGEQEGRERGGKRVFPARFGQNEVSKAEQHPHDMPVERRGKLLYSKTLISVQLMSVVYLKDIIICLKTYVLQYRTPYLQS